MQRSHLVVSPFAWLTGVFRPWLVASISGAAIGAGLLTVESSPGNSSSYPEFEPRAAVYEPSTSRSFPEAGQESLNSDTGGEALAESPVVFENASPISATQESDSLPLPVTP